MKDFFIHIDHQISFFINQHHNGLMDYIMFWFSHKYIWTPFYLYLLYYLYLHYKTSVWKIIPIVAILIAISDQCSVCFKNYFLRLRPCHHPLFQEKIHLVFNICGGNFGFYSSHASNSMALAVFLIGLLYHHHRKSCYLLLIYVIGIGYSRIYMGQHFLGDVIMGWIMGGIFGFCLLYFTKKYVLKNIQ